MSLDGEIVGQPVRVALGPRSYDIVIAGGALDKLASWIGPADAVPIQATHVVVVMDAGVEATHGAAVVHALRHVPRCDSITIPSGEPSKSVGRLEWLWNQLLDHRVDRQTLLVAVGGGVVGDLAGFAAATYTRGIRFVQVPTTLLAQVDSSVGGKTGINLDRAKNMVGAFWQPALVVIDPLTLKTLPEREFRSGLAEVVKYGIILSPDLFEYLEHSVEPIAARDPSRLAHIIGESCRLKAEVVTADERETTGRRAVLNYGHTFAHAFEAVCGYGELLHGEAVAVGMQCAAELAVRIGWLPKTVARRQAELLTALQLPVALPRQVSVDALMEAMRHDKKSAAGVLRLILPDRLGNVRSVEGIDADQIRDVLEQVALARA